MQSLSIRRLLALHAVAAALVLPGQVLAHGAPDPQHGGVVTVANDMGYELVATADGAAIYVTDHDEDYDVKNMAGKLTVLNGTQRSEAALVPAGGNKLEAKGVKLAKGARAVATFEGSSRKTTTVRFTVR